LKSFIIILFSFTLNLSYAQVKTLIPAEEEVNLPIDTNGQISMSVSFAETQIKHEKLVPLFLSLIDKTLNPNQYYVIDKGANFIELFIVYPCRGFNLSNIQSHEIINEGIISSTLLIEFKKEDYDILLTNFEWIDRKKTKHNLDKIYSQYIINSNLKDKVKYYGILKSCEISIAETYSNLTVIIEEVIKQKSLQ
jgi:hypothetical protein